MVGQTVKLSFTQDGLMFVGTAVSQADKTWNFTQKLTQGTWTVVAEVADAAGRTDTDERTFDIATADTGGGGAAAPDEPSAPIETPGVTTDSTPDISGSGEAPGWTVTVVVDGQTMTTVVDDHGNWTLTVTNPLRPGVHIVTITTSDPFGGAVTYTPPRTSTPPPSTSPPV